MNGFPERGELMRLYIAAPPLLRIGGFCFGNDSDRVPLSAAQPFSSFHLPHPCSVIPISRIKNKICSYFQNTELRFRADIRLLQFDYKDVQMRKSAISRKQVCVQS